MAFKIVRLSRLLARAAQLHPNDRWVRAARELVPDLEGFLPCGGSFKESPHCDEAHQHGLYCGSETDICTRCGRTNGEHRTAWAALE